MKYIIFLSLLIMSFSSQAAPTCSKNGTTVIYTNGVMTSKKEARIAMKEIDKLNIDSQIDLKKVNDPVLAYNYSESLAKDFVEAAVQRFPTSYLKSQGVSNGYAAFMGFLNGGFGNAIYDVALNSILNQYLEIQTNWISDRYNQSKYNETINEIKKHYQDAFGRGERVFAISHSQGGLFMNDVYNLLEESDNKRKFFSGFQIASPLNSEMSGHFGFATHDKDRLINFIRGRAGALNANVVAPAYIVNDNTGSIRNDFIEYYINHGILTSYLYDTPVQFNEPTIRSQVISELIKTAQLLESNCPKAVINHTKNNLAVNFDSTGNTDLTGLTYSWNFGDGQKSALKAPTHNYSQAGTYNVILVVTDVYGNSNQKGVMIEVAGLNSSVTFCNAGPVTSDMNFLIDDTISFSSHHELRLTDNDPTVCECHTVQLAMGSTHKLEVTGIIPELIGASPAGLEILYPIKGEITISKLIETYAIEFRHVLINDENVLQFYIYRGLRFACDEYVYK